MSRIEGEINHELTPEERTKKFFSQNYDTLSEQLQNRLIVSTETSKGIIVTEALPYSREDNTGKYKKMWQMEAGELWILPFPFRHTSLSLIVAKDDKETGACVRLKKANKVDLGQKAIVPLERERDIVAFLGLSDNAVYELKFLDSTNTLYVSRKEETESDQQETGQIDPEEANRQMMKLLEEI